MHIFLPGEIGNSGGYCKWDTNQKRNLNIISTALLSQNAWIVLLGLGFFCLFFGLLCCLVLFCCGVFGGGVLWSKLVCYRKTWLPRQVLGGIRIAQVRLSGEQGGVAGSRAGRVTGLSPATKPQGGGQRLEMGEGLEPSAINPALVLWSPQNFNWSSSFFFFFSPLFLFVLFCFSLPNPLLAWAFICQASPQASAAAWSICWVPGSGFIYLCVSFGEFTECEMGWLSITRWLLRMMPFQSVPCAPVPAAEGPWGAAAGGGSPGSQAGGATRVRLDRATLSPSVLFSVLSSVPLLCSPKNCVLQVQIPDQGLRSTPSSEWVFRNNGLFFLLLLLLLLFSSLFNVTFCLGVHFFPVPTSRTATKADSWLCTPLLMSLLVSFWPLCGSGETWTRSWTLVLLGRSL